LPLNLGGKPYRPGRHPGGGPGAVRPGQILVEQLVMADLLAMALMVGLAGIILPRR
jgi:hypothetical protein